MYHHEYPITPSQPAITGALSLFVEGGLKDDPRQMLFGLSVLRHGTAEQIEAAMPAVQAGQRVSKAEIEALFAK